VGRECVINIETHSTNGFQNSTILATLFATLYARALCRPRSRQTS
jgi:hypothetical protein